MGFSFRQLSPANLILTPLKQHLGCCVIAPLIVKFLGGAALAATLARNTYIELLFLFVLLPPVVWAILKLEDKWRARHERKHATHGEQCDTHCHAEPPDFKKRYWVNLAIAFLIALVLHLTVHHHNRAAAPAITAESNLVSR
jgi:hypothetical protein